MKFFLRTCLIFWIIIITCSCKNNPKSPIVLLDSIESAENPPQFSVSPTVPEVQSFNTYTTLLVPQILSASPLSASFKVGHLELLGLEGLCEKLDDISIDAFEDSISEAQTILDDLAQFNVSLLDQEQMTTYEMLLYQNQLIVDSKPFLLYSPMIEPSSGIQSSILLTLIQIELNNEIDVQNYLKRLEALPVFFEQVMAYETARKEQGLLLPSSLYALVLEQMDVIHSEPADFMIYQDFSQSIDTIDSLSSAEQSAYKNICLEIVKNKILPSYAQLKLFVQTLQTDEVSSGNLSTQPLGKDYYQYLITKETSYDMSCEELLSLVDKEITHLNTQLQVLYFQDPELLSQDLSSTLPEYQSIDSLYALETDCLAQQFYDYDVSPANDFVIPDYLSNYLAAGFYFPVSIDGTSYGNMYLGSEDYTHPDASTLELLFHEDIPGHHLYFSQFYGSDAPFIRKLYSWLPYEEGWAQYIQGLAIDYYGLNEELTSFLKLVSRLSYFYMLRCDIQFHAFGFDRDQIQEEYMQMGFSATSASKAINRMIAHPGEIIHYVFGAYKMEQYQSTCMETLKQHFDIKDFHGLLLENGGVPFKRMDVIVDDYIQEVLKDPSIPF